MEASKPVGMLVIYRVKKEREKDFLPLLKRHWPTLNQLGLVTPVKPTFSKGSSKDGRLSFVETFQWKDKNSPNVAHQTPEVMQVWEPMGPMLEGMELIEIEPLEGI